MKRHYDESITNSILILAGMGYAAEYIRQLVNSYHHENLPLFSVRYILHKNDTRLTDYRMGLTVSSRRQARVLIRDQETSRVRRATRREYARAAA